jgi:hypothetical protein
MEGRIYYTVNIKMKLQATSKVFKLIYCSVTYSSKTEMLRPGGLKSELGKKLALGMKGTSENIYRLSHNRVRFEKLKIRYKSYFYYNPLKVHDSINLKRVKSILTK